MRLYKRSGVVYSSRSRANIQLARRLANNAEKHVGMALCLCICILPDKQGGVCCTDQGDYPVEKMEDGLDSLSSCEH